MKNKAISKQALVFVFIAVVYFLLASLGQLFNTVTDTVSPLWPASGFALGAYFLFGSIAIPGVVVGIFFSHVRSNYPLSLSVLITVGNTLEMYIGYQLINFFQSKEYKIKYFLKYIEYSAAILIATLVCGGLASFSFYIHGKITSEIISSFWTTWSTGNFIGILLITPLMLYLKSDYKLNSKFYHPILGYKMFLFLSLVIGSFFIISKINYPLSVFCILPLVLYVNLNFSAALTSAFNVVLCSFFLLIFFYFKLFSLGVTASGSTLSFQLLFFCLSLTTFFIIESKKRNSIKYTSISLVFGWGISAALLSMFLSGVQENDKKHFNDLVVNQLKSIHSSFEYYSEALKGGKSFVVSTEQITPVDWKKFIDTWNIVKSRPGVRGIGIVYPVLTKDIPKFVRKVRSYGVKDFSIKYLQEKSKLDQMYNDHFIITYLEPIQHNLKARGLDLGSEENRRSSIEHARDTGEVTLTKKVYLIQDSFKRAGFLLYQPIYKDGFIPNTIAERRRNLIAYTYAPFVTEDFFKGSLLKSTTELEFYFYEGSNAVSENLLYSNVKNKNKNKNKEIIHFERIDKIRMGEQSFSVGWRKSKEFNFANTIQSSWVFTICALITLLFASLINSLENMNVRAQEMADDKTKLLKLSEKSLEEALLKAQKAALVKSDFLANMSHEIRTPMNAIIGATDLLLETSLTEEQNYYVEMFKRSGNSLLYVLNDILDLSKIESGFLHFDNTPFNLKVLVENSVKLIGHKANEKNVVTKVKYLENMPIAFVGDSQRISQVLNNFLLNAIKFTEKGSIEISVSKATSGRNGNIQVSIADTGIGIHEDNISKLFSAFVQADSSVTKKFGGSGLGLAICKKLSELMGGEVWVESEFGKGACFYFTLNLQVASVSEASVLITDELNLQGVSILVIKENNTERLSLQSILDHFGVVSYFAEDVNNGMNLIQDYLNKNLTIDMVIIDSKNNYNNFFNFINSNIDKFNFPIVFSNSEDNSLTKEDCKSIGGVECLDWPYSRDYIYKSFSNLLLFKYNRSKNKELKIVSNSMKLINQDTVLKILIVDDYEDNRNLVKAYLKNTTYLIHEAENGEVALLKIKNETYDIIFMDIQMPVMDGYTATKSIRLWEKENNLKPVMIVALTAYIQADDKDRCLAAGCDMHMGKPLKKKVLYDFLNEESLKKVGS